MDSIESKIREGQSKILKSISSYMVGSQIEKSIEHLSISEFEAQVAEGTKFYTKEGLERLERDVRVKISKAYTATDKNSIRKSIDERLNSLTQVVVTADNGKEFLFYKDSVKE